jgi:8-oxo-dGTP pyrophosphatase MutT (NUDIX family)
MRPLAADADWQAALRARSDAPPEPPRVALGWHQSGTLIGSIEPGWAERLIGAGVLLRRTPHGWAVDAARGAPLDAALAVAANALRRLGPAAAWRNELVTVTDNTSKPVARIERAATRALGIATQSVHLVGATPDGSVWVQQRAFNKATDPGQWDTMVGGLVSAGETVRDTLRRETHEEAGLRITALAQVAPIGHLSVRRPVPHGYMVERIDMFEAVVPRAEVPVNRDGEVAAFECLAPAALWQRLRDGLFTIEASLILLHWLQRNRLMR